MWRGRRYPRWRALGTWAWACIVVLLVAACGGEAETSTSSIPPAPGADSPVAAVEELVTAVAEPNFPDASRLAMPGHAALAALAEGATFVDVADALREGDEEVAANFWSGFAQGAGEVLTGTATTVDDGVVTQGEFEYHQVAVQPPEGEPKTLIVREDNGYRIDIFASFGTGLADKMITPAERLLAAQTEDSRLVLTELQTIVPSLMVASSLPGTTVEASQQILALIEVITRVG